ncbi:hypothetical protein PAMP_007307 [Pampus punctatissimus]
MNREAESFRYTESTALLTALDWTGSDGTGTPPDEGGSWGVVARFGEGEGEKRRGGGCRQFVGGRGHSGMQPSLRQHKQHADTVTGNIVIIIILLFKVSLKTSKLYKKEENRFFALMKNTFFDFSLLQRRF